jgi:hypothetical protein
MPLEYRIEKRIKERKKFNKSLSFETIEKEENKIKHVKKKAISLDISEDGLGMRAESILSEGWVLKLFLPVPEVEISIPVFAEVMWVKEEIGYFRAGLRFLQ